MLDHYLTHVMAIPNLDDADHRQPTVHRPGCNLSHQLYGLRGS
jgi:hypothetical protein